MDRKECLAHKGNQLPGAAYLATLDIYRMDGGNARYDLDDGIFKGTDKSRTIAVSRNPATSPCDPNEQQRGRFKV
jgi:hypothetical protein